MPRLIAVLLLVLAVGCREAEPPAGAVAPTTESPLVTSSDLEATSTEATATTVVAQDVTGGYFAMVELPAEFAELDHLLLATIDENANPAPLNGFLRPKDPDAKDYRLDRPKLEGKRLTFRTEAVAGVQYEFQGVFEVLGNFAANPPAYETAVLTGTLTKLREGRSVASTPVRFRYEAGG
jgi:hypothetical protein